MQSSVAGNSQYLARLGFAVWWVSVTGALAGCQDLKLQMLLLSAWFWQVTAHGVLQHLPDKMNAAPPCKVQDCNA